MIKTRILSILALGSFFWSSSVLAEDGQFTGPYVGAELGYSRIRVVQGVGVFGPYEVGATVAESGMYYGGSIGYRYQYDNGMVLGVEAFGGSTTNNIEYEGETLASVGRILGIEGVVGYAMGKVLVFATAGYSNGKVKGDGLEGPFNESEGAIRYGGGIEIRFTDNVSGRFKFTRANYSQEDTEVKNSTATAGIVVQF